MDPVIAEYLKFKSRPEQAEAYATQTTRTLPQQHVSSNSVECGAKHGRNGNKGRAASIARLFTKRNAEINGQNQQVKGGRRLAFRNEGSENAEFDRLARKTRSQMAVVG